jgi:hypothetical protein
MYCTSGPCVLCEEEEEEEEEKKKKILSFVSPGMPQALKQKYGEDIVTFTK